ncbi:MAG: Bax inhibitor-1/YccA family protein [Rhodocyclaceae bacterium]|nr:Bax inhibitor-1/YccA family protein [Rhodocyclaceae bacterium]MBP6109243.1 Bax inhibitor-1/YccA family protein [Rhodocyclaceae bacterium]MBP6278714.1 Bax inhibitor-1/YccA family protein [Rhodocyclaceae bacterium]
METVRDYSQASVNDIAVQQNRVLRNTYALLAVTMVPTVLGALLGVQLNFSFMAGSPFITMLLSLAIMFGFIFAIQRTKDSSLGVFVLLGFTFFMGLLLGPMLQYAIGFKNGGTMIALAAGGTGAIFMTLAGVASNTARDFSNLGKFLFAGLILMILAGVANMFFQIPALSLALSALGVMIFSAYVLYDINNIVKGGETNYISATLNVYLDIYNIFINLLNLIMAFTGERD